MERLFVYGTLAPGRANHHLLAEVPGEWMPARLRGRLHDEGWGAEMGCPGIVPCEDGDEVEGYLFCSTVLAGHWPMLDAFEGPGYRRVSVRVTTDSGATFEASVYALRRHA